MTPARLVAVVLWMCGTLLSFSAMAVSIRELSRALTVFEVLTVRCAVGLAIVVAVLLVRPSLWRTLSRRRLGLHLARNGCHLASQSLWTLGLTLLPLATVFALEFTMPAWTALLAVAFLGERMTPSRMGVVVLGFLGVLVIVRPGFENFRPAALIVLLAAFGFGISMAVTKKLTGTESAFAIVFWMNLMQLPMALAVSDPLFVTRIDSSLILPALGTGAAGLSAHYCLSNAFRAGDAIIVMPMDFLRIPLIAGVGWWLYGESVDGFEVVGTGVIIAGIAWNLSAESRALAAPAGSGAGKTSVGRH